MRTQLEPKRVSEVLPGLLKKLGLEEKAADAALGPVWKEAVGSNIALHTKPVQFQRGCLVVAVDTPVWKMELERHCKGDILKKLGSKDSRIKSLRFQIGEII